MTTEVAIKRLDEIYMRLDFTDSHGYRIDLSTYEEALKIAIEGLEKQIQLESFQ